MSDLTDEEVRARQANKAAQSLLEAIADEDDHDENGRRKIMLPKSATVPLSDVWFAISTRYRVTPRQAANFVERSLPETPAIYGANDAGLFAPLIRSYFQAWCDSSNAAEAANWDREWCRENLDFLRLSANDASRITGAATRAYSDSPTLTETPGPPAYLDPEHPRYAPKLAAAVSAWLAVEGHAGMSPKAALEKWLNDNANAFGLVNEAGKPNATGIEECAKVANWRMTGGASKTPGA